MGGSALLNHHEIVSSNSRCFVTFQAICAGIPTKHQFGISPQLIS
jgi:hypothetical protein